MPEPVTVLKANSRSERREFLDYPYRLHERAPNWIAPLRSEQSRLLDERRHPFYRHAEVELFLAKRGAETVGRIAAILDGNAPQVDGRKVGAFGFFDCNPDEESARVLLDAAREWLQAKKAGLMRGPTDPSFNYNCGVLVEGFDDPPAVGVAYNPSYYGRLLAGAGLRGVKDLVAVHLRSDDLRTSRARRLARYGLATPGLRLRSYDPRQREREVQRIWELYSQSWSTNWGFVPASLEEVRLLATDIEKIADLRLVQFCELEGRAVGIAVVLPDWNQALSRANGSLLPFGWWRVLRARRNITRARIYIVGVIPALQGTAMAAAFLSMAESPASAPYRDVEASWILEDNHAALRGLETLGGRIAKRYRIYDALI